MKFPVVFTLLVLGLVGHVAECWESTTATTTESNEKWTQPSHGHTTKKEETSTQPASTKSNEKSTTPPGSQASVGGGIIDEADICQEWLLIIYELAQSQGNLEILVQKLLIALKNKQHSLCILKALPQIGAKVDIVVEDVNQFEATLNNLEKKCSSDS